MEENQTENFYSNLSKYFTKRNIIISLILVIIIFFAIMFWNQYKLATVIIQPNLEEVNLVVEKSVLMNNGETVQREIYLTKENINNLSLKLEPNYYYYLKASKDQYTSKFIEINPKFHETITLNIFLDKPLIVNDVSFATLKNNEEILYVNQANNKLTSYNLTSKNQTEMFPHPLIGLKKILYSPDKNKAIIQISNDNIALSGGYAKSLGDENNTIYTPTPSPFYKPEIADNTITTWFINFDNQETIFINRDIREINWISNDRIIYDYFKINEYIEGKTLDFTNSLNTANQNGEQWQNILDLNQNAIFFPKIIPSPDNQKVILIPTPLESGYEITGSLNIFNLENQQVSKIAEKNILSALWSPDNQKILYTKIESSQKNKPSLWLTDTNGTEHKNLEIYTTVEKSYWLNDQEIISAIPVSPQQPNILSPNNTPDNLTSLKDPSTSDALYLINVETGTKTNLFAGNFQYLNNVKNIFSDGTNVYFTDKANKLYSLPLH
ncbi:MAG: hypothetical protein ACOZAR_04015 [Patescibacteria group bacterium]